MTHGSMMAFDVTLPRVRGHLHSRPKMSRAYASWAHRTAGGLARSSFEKRSCSHESAPSPDTLYAAASQASMKASLRRVDRTK